MQALLDSGLEQVRPEAAEVNKWRDIVSRSHRELAAQGEFDRDLLERLQGLIAEYRSGSEASGP
jgi:hypothetical protein